MFCFWLLVADVLCVLSRLFCQGMSNRCHDEGASGAVTGYPITSSRVLPLASRGRGDGLRFDRSILDGWRVAREPPPSGMRSWRSLRVWSRPSGWQTSFRMPRYAAAPSFLFPVPSLGHIQRPCRVYFTFFASSPPLARSVSTSIRAVSSQMWRLVCLATPCSSLCPTPRSGSRSAIPCQVTPRAQHVSP